MRKRKTNDMKKKTIDRRQPRENEINVLEMQNENKTATKGIKQTTLIE